MIDYETLEPRVAELATAFGRAAPFPHLVLDNFFETASAEQIHAEFPGIRGEFRRHIHQHSHKHASNDWSMFPPAIKAACEDLNSDRFVRLLSHLTGISPVYADPQLVGGGVHLIKRGGFLDIHADFNEHPVLKKKRCLNVLIYFNKNWKDEYQGALELWDKDMSRCVVKAWPVFNRCVIFETTTTSFHGHPAPLACPDGMTRCSLATYYYTDWSDQSERRLITTDYQVRPTDYVKRARKALRGLVGPRVSKWIDSLGR